MKTYKRILIILAAVFTLTALAAAGEEGSKSKSFNVARGGTAEVSTSVGDIKISVWDKNEVYVRVEGLDDEGLDKVRMTQDGNTVRVMFRSSWYEGHNNVNFYLTVPPQFNLDLNTSGGDLEVKGNLKGKVEGSTSGGDIKLGDITEGPVDVTTSGGDITLNSLEGAGKLKTSGGDIRTGKINGNLFVHTSGGDIRIDAVMKNLDAKTAGGDIIIGYTGGQTNVSTSGGNISIGDIGSEANVSTSGGDISVGKINGQASLNTAGGDIELKGANGRVVAKTSGGDLNLQDVTGSIDGKTSGGEIDARLVPAGKEKSRLISSGGDVRLYVDEKAKVTIEATIRLHGWDLGRKQYVVKSEFPKESYETDSDEGEIRAVYKLNGGGDIIELRTSNSNIEIHKLHK
jgi:DUF4097 and DUF4098 domain-containing protein YvlB